MVSHARSLGGTIGSVTRIVLKRTTALQSGPARVRLGASKVVVGIVGVLYGADHGNVLGPTMDGPHNKICEVHRIARARESRLFSLKDGRGRGDRTKARLKYRPSVVFGL